MEQRIFATYGNETVEVIAMGADGDTGWCRIRMNDGTEREVGADELTV